MSVSTRSAEKLVLERLRLLELEASVQRLELAATLAEWQDRRALHWGGQVAGWGMKLLSVPKIRWLIATTVLSRLRRKFAPEGRSSRSRRAR